MTKNNKKIFAALFFTMLSTVTGVGIVVPLLPIYADSLGATGIYIGLIFGSFSISRALFVPLFGRLSDKKGRKPLIIMGLISYSIVSVIYVFAQSINTLIAVRFLQGITSAMTMPVIQAYVGDITTKGKEGVSLGLFNMSLFFGLSMGPLLGGVINDLWGINEAFLSMGLLALISLVFVSIFLPKTDLEPSAAKRKETGSIKNIIKDLELIGLVLFRFANTSCIGIIWSFLPLLAHKELSLSSAKTGVLLTVGIAIVGIFNIPMGIVADKINKKIMVIIGGLTAAFGIFLLSKASSFAGLFIGNFIFGIGGGIATPAIMALTVIKGHEKNAVGTVMSFLTSAHSLGIMTGSIAAGIMSDIFDLRKAFISGCFVLITGLILFLAFNLKRKNNIVVKKDIFKELTPPTDIP